MATNLEDFTNGCRKYSHYLDATCSKLVGIDMIPKDTNLEGSTAISQDLFMPTGFNTDQDSIYIVFDSRCTTTMTPFKEDFVGKITPVIKSMRGLGATATVAGEGYFEWNFRDGYGVK